MSCFIEIIKEICQEEEISIQAFSSDFMFQLKKEGKVNYIFGYQFGLNTAVSHMICEDKSTASELLSYAGIPNIEHYCFMSPRNIKYIPDTGNWDKILSMFKKYKTLVLKDNKGTGGFSVYYVRNTAELEHATQILFQSSHSISVSPYYPILEEYRIIILDNEIQLIYHKERKHLIGDGIHTIKELYAMYLLNDGISYPIEEKDSSKILKTNEIYPLHWKHNLGQGASPVIDTDQTVIEPLKQLAKKAANCIGIRFAAIDIVKILSNKELQYRILEVNSGVMMEYLSQTNQEFRQIAKEIYRQAIRKMMKE